MAYKIIGLLLFRLLLRRQLELNISQERIPESMYLARLL